MRRARSGRGPAARRLPHGTSPPASTPPLSPGPTRVPGPGLTSERDYVASSSPKSPKSPPKSSKPSKTTNGCITPDGGGLPRRKNGPPKQPTIGRPLWGGLQAKVARAARDIAGELGWRRARLRHGVRSPGRLSPQRQRRQKCARGAGEASRGTREGVRLSAWRVGGRLPCARAGRPAASEARVVDP